MAEIFDKEVEEAAGGAKEATFDYTVVYGDTLSGIAIRFHTTLSKLMQLNNIPNPDKIKAGQVIKVPTGNMKGWI